MAALGLLGALKPRYDCNVVALRRQAARWCSDSVDIDLFGQALEALWAKAFEHETKTRRKVSYGPAGQDLTCTCQRADASAGVHSHAAPLIAASGRSAVQGAN